MVKVMKQHKIHHLTSSYVRKHSIEFNRIHAIIQIIKQINYKVRGFYKYNELHTFPDSQFFHRIIRVSEKHQVFAIFIK